MFTDTHSHLYSKEFDSDIDKVIINAKSNNVSSIYLPNIDISTIEKMNSLVDKDPRLFKAMIGLHPGSVDSDYVKNLDIIRQELKKNKYVGIGEVGIDLYWDKTYKQEQIDAFETQVKWAKEFDLPVIIHARDAIDLTIDIIEKHQTGQLRGIFHCFTGNTDQAFKIMKLGFYMGIGGILTYKNSGLKQVVHQIPIEYMVLETDSPYLPPVPFRGKRNESAYLVHIASELAEVKNISIKDIAEITTNNAQKIFAE